MPPKKPVLKVILVGDTGVGKTSLMHRYDNPMRMFSTRHRPTIQADFIAKDVNIEGQQATFMIWDTSGQERFQSLGTAFYRDALCCVLVFDVTSSKSFDALGRWRENFFEHACPRNPDGFPVVVLGNKAEDEDAGEREVPKARAMRWCEANGNLMYFETSAKELTNVEEALYGVAVAALRQNRRDENFEKYGQEGGMEDAAECRMCICQ